MKKYEETVLCNNNQHEKYGTAFNDGKEKWLKLGCLVKECDGYMEEIDKKFESGEYKKSKDANE